MVCSMLAVGAEQQHKTVGQDHRSTDPRENHWDSDRDTHRRSVGRSLT